MGHVWIIPEPLKGGSLEWLPSKTQKGHCRFGAHLSIPFVRAGPDPDWKSGLPKISADFGFLAAPRGGKTDWKPKSSTKPTLYKKYLQNNG